MRHLCKYVYASPPDVKGFLLEKNELTMVLRNTPDEVLVRSPQTTHLVRRINNFIARWNPSADRIDPEYVVYTNNEINCQSKWKIVRQRLTIIKEGLRFTNCNVSINANETMRITENTLSIRKKDFSLTLFGNTTTPFCYKIMYGGKILIDNGTIYFADCMFRAQPIDTDITMFIGCHLAFKLHGCSCVYHLCTNTLRCSHGRVFPDTSACCRGGATYLFARRREIARKAVSLISENYSKLVMSASREIIAENFL